MALTTASAAPLEARPRMMSTFSIATVTLPWIESTLLARFASSTTAFAVSALMFKDLVTSSPGLRTGNVHCDAEQVSTMWSDAAACWMAFATDKKGLPTVPSPVPSFPSSEVYKVAAVQVGNHE